MGQSKEYQRWEKAQIQCQSVSRCGKEYQSNFSKRMKAKRAQQSQQSIIQPLRLTNTSFVALKTPKGIDEGFQGRVIVETLFPVIFLEQRYFLNCAVITQRTSCGSRHPFGPFWSCRTLCNPKEPFWWGCSLMCSCFRYFVTFISSTT